MKHYKTPKGEVYAYELDGSQDRLIKPDMMRMSDAEVNLHRNPPPTPEQVLATLTAAVQARLDGFAKQRGYDGILSACSYAASKVERYAKDGQLCVDLRDKTWDAACKILADVEAHNRPASTEAELLAELPVLEWPA